MFIKALVIAAFLYSILSNRNNALCLLLFLGFCNTIISTILNSYNQDIGFNNKVYIILHSLVWFYLLYKEIDQKKILIIGSSLYILATIYDLIFIENYIKCNNAIVFVLGAFIYISVFISESYFQLKKENFLFYKSNNFILIFSPILFFLGYSFIFGFQSRILNDTLIVGNIKLYSIISHFVNIIYYSLICLYMYKEENLKNA